MHQLVIGRAQQRVAGIGAEAAAVDQRLRMLDAKADGKRLGFDVDAALVQHLEGVARAVADGQHHMVGWRCVRRSASTTPRTCPFSISMSVHPALEADFAAQRLDAVARIFSTMLTSRKVPICGLLT